VRSGSSERRRDQTIAQRAHEVPDNADHDDVNENIKVIRSTAHVGAEIDGIDLNKPLAIRTLYRWRP
jgi:hypothetical protein